MDDIVAVEARRISIVRPALTSVAGLVVAAGGLLLYCIESECISN